jgi:hypothetical protein
MKNTILFILGASSTLLLLAGCKKEENTPVNQTCADEHVIEVYQDKKGIITKTELDTYCVIVDSTAIARGSYPLDDYLVPIPGLPPQYQVEGLRVVISGRKKSCYGLTTLPNLRTVFGYKLEVDAIKASQ